MLDISGGFFGLGTEYLKALPVEFTALGLESLEVAGLLRAILRG